MTWPRSPLFASDMLVEAIATAADTQDFDRVVRLTALTFATYGVENKKHVWFWREKDGTYSVANDTKAILTTVMEVRAPRAAQPHCISPAASLPGREGRRRRANGALLPEDPLEWLDGSGAEGDNLSVSPPRSLFWAAAAFPLDPYLSTPRRAGWWHAKLGCGPSSRDLVTRTVRPAPPAALFPARPRRPSAACVVWL